MLIKARFRFPEILFGMLLAVAIFAIGAVFFSLPNSSPPTQIQTGAQSSDHGARNKQEISWWQDPVAIFTLGLVFIGIVHACIFYGQLRLIGKSLKPAELAARAAQKNAQALMDAESAQIYVVLARSNIQSIFERTLLFDLPLDQYENPPTDSPTEAPWVEYQLRNYGKSPAILQVVMHGIYIEREGVEPDVWVTPREGAMEIVGVGEQTLPIRCEFRRQFTSAHAREINLDASLHFHGRAEFMDHFGRRQTLDWDYIADRGAWHLVTHRNARENPDS
jgi:hypothetical protein